MRQIGESSWLLKFEDELVGLALDPPPGRDGFFT
jgi:hypothetical protein